MRKIIPLLMLLLSLSSCVGHYHRGPGSVSGFVFMLLIVVVVVWAITRAGRSSDQPGRRSNLRILLIVLAVLLLWPLIGLILVPIIAVSMGLFFFFPPLLLLVLVIVLLVNRGRRR